MKWITSKPAVPQFDQRSKTHLLAMSGAGRRPEMSYEFNDVSL
jgi:hypothetical protein